MRVRGLRSTLRVGCAVPSRCMHTPMATPRSTPLLSTSSPTSPPSASSTAPRPHTIAPPLLGQPTKSRLDLSSEGPAWEQGGSNHNAAAHVSRRGVGMFAAASVAVGLGLDPEPVMASKLPAFADSAWEALGGGSADLYFPEQFLGVWDVTSTLTKLETPMGEDYVPDMRQVQRAEANELNQPTKFQVKFIRSSNGKVIFDRKFNTSSLVTMYYGDSMNIDDRISWNPDDPNVLLLSLPKGLIIRTRVTRRSEEIPGPDRIETSEYIEQVFDDGVSTTPKVKASQCFTKYKWREMTPALIAANGPAVIATQVVSDFLTPYDGDEKYIRAMNKPVVQYTYKMQFRAAVPPTP